MRCTSNHQGASFFGNAKEVRLRCARIKINAKITKIRPFGPRLLLEWLKLPTARSVQFKYSIVHFQKSDKLARAKFRPNHRSHDEVNHFFRRARRAVFNFTYSSRNSCAAFWASPNDFSEAAMAPAISPLRSSINPRRYSMPR
jgi:hypothetical protein